MDTAAYRDTAALEESHWWFAGRRRIIDALLASLPLRRGARVLEIGCGSGGNLSMLTHYGSLSAGEYNDEARRASAARGIGRVAPCALPHTFPFDNEVFDLVVMFDVLEHIEEDAATLVAVRRHLASEGWLVMTVPAFPFLWSGHDVQHHHFRRYTRAVINRRLREAGFKAGFQSFFNFWLFPAVALVRLIKNLIGGSGAGGDLAMPPQPVNRILAQLFASERFAMGRFALPFGVSYIIAATPVGVERLDQGGGKSPDPR